MKIYEKLSAADSFSMLNALFGISSIFMLILSDFHNAFIFILLAVLADGMDGMMARRYGSSIGIIDEFADMISFVAAPAALAFSTYGIVLMPLLYAYIIASIIHLLNYHYSEKNIFVGLPTPAAALLAGSACLAGFPLWAIVIILVFVTVLLASPIKFVRIEGLSRAIAAFIIVITIVMCYEIFFILLFLFTLIYVIASPIKIYLEK